MASKLLSVEISYCLVCHNIFQGLVLLSCGHKVCEVCAYQFCNGGGAQQCPVCRERTGEISLLVGDPRKRREFVLRTEPTPTHSPSFCALHTGKIQFFCLEDQRFLCTTCCKTKAHENHEWCDIDIAARQLKEKLQTTLRPLQNKLQVFKGLKLNCDQTVMHIKHQAQNTERQLKAEFEELHQFLRDEEAARMAALRQETEQKRQRVKEKVEEMEKDMASLAAVISIIGDEFKAESISFMQNFKETVKSCSRAQCTLQDPHMDPGVLIDVAKHVGNLKFRAWERMQEVIQCTPVTLDPNTAHPLLTISDDLTSVERTCTTRHLPNNAERFDQRYCVLGSRGFIFGPHTWDTEVLDAEEWEVGVTTARVPRGGKTHLDRDTWSVRFRRGEHEACWSTTAVKLRLKEGVQRVRVYLNCRRGEVAFSDPLSNTQLFTFNHSLTEKLFPFFICPCKHSVLRILPAFINTELNSLESD
ncbi:E3 ubiquitin-protein ligase TRIM35-like [Brachyhypopomus gauderio]|uniref:E3 ubiquitin-protein ligase TRIM35-like n=1 Tax=Brachyhypopomus gauderio TaxID=698409 RepID=UPI004042D71E